MKNMQQYARSIAMQKTQSAGWERRVGINETPRPVGANKPEINLTIQVSFLALKKKKLNLTAKNSESYRSYDIHWTCPKPYIYYINIIILY